MLFKLFNQEVAMRPLSLEWVQQSVAVPAESPMGRYWSRGTRRGSNSLLCDIPRCSPPPLQAHPAPATRVTRHTPASLREHCFLSRLPC